MPNSYIRCDLCTAVVHATEYKAHLKTAHKAKRVIKKTPTQSPSSNRTSTSHDRNREKEIAKTKIVKKRTKTDSSDRWDAIRQAGRYISIIWSDIDFDKDRIIFSATRIGEVLNSFPLEGALKQLNVIKKDFFERNHGKKAYKLFFFKSRLVPELSPGWDGLKSCIEKGIQHFHFNFQDPPIRALPTVRTRTYSSKVEFEAHYRLILARNQYLQYLAEKHCAPYPIMTIEETKNSRKEDSLIFRILDKYDNVYIVWENVLPNRATHVFRCPKKGKENYQKKYRPSSQRPQTTVESYSTVRIADPCT